MNTKVNKEKSAKEKSPAGIKNSSITFKTTSQLKRIVETICFEERITATSLIEGLIKKYNEERKKNVTK